MNMPRRSGHRRLGGFTLVEIAIVLVIVSLLLAAGIGISVAVVDNVRARTTKQNMDAVKISLQSFIARNGRLPCPAVETLDPTNANYGIEAATTGTCTGTVDLPGGGGIDAAKRGVVPWKTMGMTLENASDGWYSQLTYMVTVTATGKNFDTVPGMRGSLYLHSATPVAAGLPATGNQINACSTTADDNKCNKAAVVILLSHGRNLSGAYTSAGVRAPLSTDAGEVENTNNNRFVVSAEPSPTFDDIVIPLAPDDFLATLATQGAIKSERALLIERARQVVTMIASESVSTRTGSPGTYTYTLPLSNTPVAYAFDATKFNGNCTTFNPPLTAGVLPPGHDGKLILDPWGQEFRYETSNTAVASGESCPNPGVLVSMGPDVTLGTADDWVYYVPLADWKDIFSKAGW